jgi:hypothetical protein
MYLRFDDGTVTASDFTLSEVQLELGSVATDFEHRSYGEILADCQRYFSVLDFTTNHLALVIRAGEDNSGSPYNYFELPVTMRGNPSGSSSGTFLDGAQFAGEPSIYETSTTAVTLRGNNGNIAAGSSQYIRGGLILLDAEL